MYKAIVESEFIRLACKNFNYHCWLWKYFSFEVLQSKQQLDPSIQYVNLGASKKTKKKKKIRSIKLHAFGSLEFLYVSILVHLRCTQQIGKNRYRSLSYVHLSSSKVMFKHTLTSAAPNTAWIWQGHAKDMTGMGHLHIKSEVSDTIRCFFSSIRAS